MNCPESRWRHALLTGDVSIGHAIRNLEETAIRIVLIIDKNNILEGTVTDGDIRRGLLSGLGMDSPINNIIHRNPLVVTPEIEKASVMQLMGANKVQQIPVVDSLGRVVGLHLWDEITVPPSRDNPVVIMAGGMGTRLRPYTENCPKPLLPIAGKPMLEHIIDRAKLEGFKNFVLAIHYLGHMIESYFGDGDKFDVKINYLRENSPLGTAGALSLLNPVPDTPFIVTNGDVITDIRYGEILDFHKRQAATATMALHLHEWQHPFGVVRTEGVEITGFEEKPIIRCHINAGVYVVEPEALSELAENQHCDMPTLFERLKFKSKRTAAYLMHEPWLDVGRPDDFNRAQNLK